MAEQPQAATGEHGRTGSWLSGEWLTGRRVVQVAGLLVVLQLLLRTWVAASGYFWQDDLIVASRAVSMPLLSSEFLMYDHDGHFMPAGFLLTGIFTHLAPLQFWPLVVAMVVMQALASLAVWRLLRLLLGDRPVLLVPLLLYLFSPLTLPAFSWWMAAVNALALQAGMAWVAADAVQLVRTGRIRFAVTGSIACALALAFFEKSIVVPVVAFAVVVLLQRAAGDPAPIMSALRCGRWLWTGLALVLAVWGWAYSSVVGSPAIGPDGAGTVPQAIGLVRTGVLRGLLPALVGGPLTWDAGAWADPPQAMTVIGGLAVLVAVVWSARRRRGCGVIWWLVAGYVAACAAAMVLGRLTVMTADVLALSLRYFSDSALVIAIALALVLQAPARTEPARHRLLTGHGTRLVAVGAVAAFVLASLWSTVTYTRAWSAISTHDYLIAAEKSLAEADVPLLDHPVPPDVLWALAFPRNLASQVFAPLEDRPEFSRATPELLMLDGSGHLADARVAPLRWIQEGEFEGCGHPVGDRRTTVVPLDGPLVPWDWTVQLNYLAGADGVLEVSLDGESVRTPVQRGPNTVFLRVLGGGENLHVRSRTAGVAVCLDSGVVGRMELVG